MRGKVWRYETDKLLVVAHLAGSGWSHPPNWISENLYGGTGKAGIPLEVVSGGVVGGPVCDMGIKPGVFW